MPSLNFPGPTRRVEFEEEISGIKAKIINDTNKEIFIKFELSLESSSKEKKLSSKSKILLSKELQMSKKDTSEWYGPYSILFSKKIFSPGKYTLKAQIISLDEENKGEIYYKITRVIYLAENPKAVGKLKDFRYEEFSEQNRELQYRVEEENNGLVIFININHPSYEIFDKLKEVTQMSKQEVNDPMKYYLLEIGLQALLTEDLNNEARFLGANRKNFLTLLKHDDESIHEKTLAYRDKIPQKMLFRAYKK